MKTKKRQEKSSKNFIYKNFKISLKSLKKTKNYIWFSFILFLIFSIIGFVFPVFFEKQVLSFIEELVNQTQGLDVLNLMRFIFINNLKSSFIAMFFGIFLGIIPLVVLVANGYVLGFVANKTTAVEGFLILWRLLPHGVFELPAVLISIAVGIKLGISMIYRCITLYNPNLSRLSVYLLIILSMLFFPISFFILLYFTLINKKLRRDLNNNFAGALRIFIFIVIPLLILAAIIEGALIYF